MGPLYNSPRVAYNEAMQTLTRFDGSTESIRPPGDIYYHYTSRESAQEISISGLIYPSGNGLIYLTDVLYRFGWQATDRLALPVKNAEVAIPVKIEESTVWLGIVPSWGSPQNPPFRRGGGQQWVVAGSISVEPYPWTWIELEVP